MWTVFLLYNLVHIRSKTWLKYKCKHSQTVPIIKFDILSKIVRNPLEILSIHYPFFPVLLQRFSCESVTYKLNHKTCRKRKQRLSPWTHWKVLTGCTHSCIDGGAGLRLVTRECLAPRTCQGSGS